MGELGWFFVCLFVFYIVHINEILRCLSYFSDWHILLSTPSRPICVVANSVVSFFFYCSIIFYCIRVPHLPYPSSYWWTSNRCFPSRLCLVMAHWIQRRIFSFQKVSALFSSNISPEVGILDHTAALRLVFWGISRLFPIVAALVYN